MWVLKKWRKSRGLQELTMTDAEKMEDTYLYKLSKAKVFPQKFLNTNNQKRDWLDLKLSHF